MPTVPRLRFGSELCQSLVLSIGLHLLLAMSFDWSPGSFEPGFSPRLAARVAGSPAASMTPLPDKSLPTLPENRAGQPIAITAPASGTAHAPASHAVAPGIAHEFDRRGSTLPMSDLYYMRNQVDVPAAPLERPPLIYPVDAYIWKLAGRVQARVYINELGEVDKVSIIQAQPPGIFEESAIAALSQVRYAPARIAGVPVKSQRLVEVGFDPYEQR